MYAHFTNAIDRESERRELMKQLAAENPSWQPVNEPGTFGCHELLDRTAMLATQVEQYVLTHPACVQNPQWYELADQAVTALNELYQRIGEAHLVDNDANSGLSPSPFRNRQP